MNKKVLISVCFLVVFTTFVSGAVYAYFNSIAVSANNIFSSGTLNLQLSKDSTQFSESVSTAFGASELSPGVCAPPGTLYMKNTGSVSGNHLDIRFVNTDSAFAHYLRIALLKLDQADLTVDDTNGNGYADLHDLSQSGILNKPLTDHVSHSLQMQICLDTGAGNDQQSKSNTLTLNVVLDQGPHSP